MSGDKRRRHGNRISDPTSAHAIAEIKSQPPSGWRDCVDPTQRPMTAEHLAEVDQIGVEAWREAEAYRAYRRLRFGADA